MRDDDHDLAEQLERIHADSYGWALQCARFDAPEAEDLLQSSYLKVLDGRARFRGESGFKTWLFAVIRRTAQERRRRERLRNWLLIGRPREVDPQPASPEAQLNRSLQAGRLVVALDSLSARQREILHLVFYSGLTIEQAAGVMDVSIGSARTHYARGKQRLRERLGAKNT